MKAYKKFKQVKTRDGKKGIIFKVRGRYASVLFDDPRGGVRTIDYPIEEGGRCTRLKGVEYNPDIVVGWPFASPEVLAAPKAPKTPKTPVGPEQKGQIVLVPKAQSGPAPCPIAYFKNTKTGLLFVAYRQDEFNYWGRGNHMAINKCYPSWRSWVPITAEQFAREKSKKNKETRRE